MDIQVWPDRPPVAGAENEGPSWRVLLGTALMALVVIGLTAQSAFVIEKLSEEVWLARGEVEYRGDSLVETIAVAMNSPGVWGPIAVQHGIDIEEFQKHYRAVVVGGTQVLSVEFEHPDPDVAMEIIDEVIQAFILQFTQVDDSQPNETLNSYLEALRGTESELLVALDNRELLTRNAQVDRQNELIAVRQAITQVALRLDGRASELDLLESLQPRVISAPYLLPEPIEPEPLKMAVVGAGAGTLLAVAAAFFVFHSDETARHHTTDQDSLELAA